MANVTQLYNLETLVAYEREGFADAVAHLKDVLAKREGLSDGFSIIRNLLADNTVTACKTSAGHLHFVSLASPAAATADCFIQFFDVATGSVNLGTTVPDFVFKCPQTKTATVLLYPGADANDLFGTAISYAVTTTGTGSTAPDAADRPTVTLGYA